MERGAWWARDRVRDDSRTVEIIKMELKGAATVFLNSVKDRFESLGINVGMDSIAKATSAVYNALEDRYLMKRDDNLSSFTSDLPAEDRRRLAVMAMNDFSRFVKEGDSAVVVKFINLCIAGHEDGNAKDFLNELVSNDPLSWLKESRTFGLLRFDEIKERHGMELVERIIPAQNKKGLS